MAAFVKLLAFCAMALILLSAQPEMNTLDNLLDKAGREISEMEIPMLDTTIPLNEIQDHPVPVEDHIPPPPKYQRI